MLNHITRLMAGLALFALLLCSCSQLSALQPLLRSDPAAASVAIMQVAVEQDASLATPVQHAAEYKLQQIPVCSGFVLRTANGIRIATAAHCLQSQQLGASVIYVDAAMWRSTSSGSRIGAVAALDLSRDVALLQLAPEDAERLAPVALELGVLSSGPELVTSFSLRAGSPLVGVGEGLCGRCASTLDVSAGWSGAPVLSVTSGKVIGMVLAFENRPHSGVFVTLPKGL